MKRIVLGILACCLIAEPAAAEDTPAAQQLLLTGKYGEAKQAFEKLTANQPVAAALGIAQAQSAVGEYDAAAKTLSDAAEKHSDHPEIPAQLACLAFSHGDYEGAARHVAAALKLDDRQLLARWVAAELHRTAGRLEEADKAYEWFIDYYAAEQSKITRSESLHLIGLAGAQYARWHRNHRQFSFIANTLYPDAIGLEKAYWPARLETGRLFLEKFNKATADKQLRAALEMNPNAADIHAAMAELQLQGYNLAEAQSSIDRALEINPKHLAAHRLAADVHLSNFEPHKALPLLEKARQLNPRDEATLGRLAACYGAIDGLKDDVKGTRLGELIDEVTGHNPHAGEFYVALGDALDKLRKFPHAAIYYQQAAKTLPQLMGVRGQLGLVYMRLGQETKARKTLDAAFDIDPFNVRVSNSLKVLEVLDEYETLETKHFQIRFDPKHDKITARYAARWLEEVYSKLSKQLDYEPEGKSLFELFNKSRNTSGHGWFSARMVGLPHVHTIGACAGKMVAMVSPTAMPSPINWARVLQHEFVHVVNLQQTNFNIPHWYTEALAVHYEGTPRPASWNEMLARRVPQGDMFNLDTINMGFVRPGSSEDWQMAYCQAELYAEYMLKRFGDDALAKMLDCYADNLTTPAAIKRSFGIETEDFEKGYQAHVKKVVASLVVGGKKPKRMTFSELDRAHREDPKNADTAARLALEYFRRRAGPKARGLADKALAINDKHPLATYVKARLFLSIGEKPAAIKMLEAVLDEKKPEEHVVGLLAAMRLKEEKYNEAARLYGLAAKQDPENLKWTKALAHVYLKSGDDAKLGEVLVTIAGHEPDSITIRKKLARLALAAKDYEAAARWCQEAIHVDVMDLAVHRTAAVALGKCGRHDDAVFEYETTVMLSPKDVRLRLALAKACVAAKRIDQAKKVLQELLEMDAQSTAARELLETLRK
jgi:tetratricopeptide (TPR) repeat protein